LTRHIAWQRVDWTIPVLVVLGLAVIWAPARPPMVDLPQHAAQLALLRDLLLHRSPWAGLVHVNFFTPYLLGYCLALPLSLIVAPLTAMKIVLSVAYVAFVAACQSIRSALGSTARLDALFCLPFFGFAYSWGFYTYLVAAPVGLVFIRVALDFSRTPRLASGMAMAALGVALLFCHGLVFLIAFAVGGAIVLANMRGLTDVVGLARRAWPFTAAVAVAAVMFVSTRTREAATDHNFGHLLFWGALPRRLGMMMINSVDAPGKPWALAIIAVLVVLPWLGGLKMDWRRNEALMIGLTTIALVLYAPSFAFSTSLLFERIVLFLLPAYAWLFVDREPPPDREPSPAGPVVAALCAGTVGIALVLHAIAGVAFSSEARDFDRVMAAAQPEGRALSLVFDRESVTQPNEDMYLHLVSWYAAERQGFVDFSFAYFHPEMVRFNAGAQPAANEASARNPEAFVWTSQDWQYRYFFVRSKDPIAAAFFAPGRPRLLAHSGEWSLYENPDWRTGPPPAVAMPSSAQGTQ